jgi:hypothetical protein
MTHDSAVATHMIIGTLGLLAYWGALLTRKGSPVHRFAGKVTFSLLIVVVLSVGPPLMLRAGPFDPGRLVQFTYLALCLATVVMLGWTAIRWKHAPEQFRGLHFKVLGPVLFLLGAIVLAAGLQRGDPVPMVLSWVGLVYGAAMIHFAWTRAPLLPTWWISWHLSAVCGLFTAVHGTLLSVVWRDLLAQDAGSWTTAAFHLGVLVVAIAMRLWFGRKRQVPWRFTRPTRAGQLVA